MCCTQQRVNNCWWRRIVFSPERTQKAISCTAIEPINDAEPQSLAAGTGSFKLSASLFAYIWASVEPLGALLLQEVGAKTKTALTQSVSIVGKAPTPTKERRSPRASNNKRL